MERHWGTHSGTCYRNKQPLPQFSCSLLWRHCSIARSNTGLPCTKSSFHNFCSWEPKIRSLSEKNKSTPSKTLNQVAFTLYCDFKQSFKNCMLFQTIPHKKNSDQWTKGSLGAKYSLDLTCWFVLGNFPREPLSGTLKCGTVREAPHKQPTGG